MNVLVRAFWNPAERRLRAGWRLLIHALVVAAVLLVIAIALRTFTAAVTPLIERLLVIGPHALLLVSALVAAKVLDRRRLADYGLGFGRRWWAELAVGLVLGAVLISGIAIGLAATGMVSFKLAPHTDLPRTPMPVLAGLLVTYNLVVAVAEETLFRGFHFRNLSEGLHGGRVSARVAILSAIALAGAVFALLHLPQQGSSYVSALNTFLGGAMFAWATVRTGRLGLAIGLHFAWNSLLGAVLGLPVSGHAAETAFFTAEVDSDAGTLWTGGAYGPEAGLPATIALLLGLFFVAIYARKNSGQSRWDLSWATYPGREPAGFHSARGEETRRSSAPPEQQEPDRE